MVIIIIPLALGLVNIISTEVGYSKLSNCIGVFYIYLFYIGWDLLIYSIITKSSFLVIIGEWFLVYNSALAIQWGFVFNTFTVHLCFIVLFISTHIHCYGSSYMGTDINSSRFVSYLSIFVFFML